MYQMSAISSGDGGTKMVVPLLHCSITDMFINRVPRTKLTNVFYLMFVQAYNPLLWNLLRLPSIITVIICHRYNSNRHIQFRDWANRYTGRYNDKPALQGTKYTHLQVQVCSVNNNRCKESTLYLSSLTLSQGKPRVQQQRSSSALISSSICSGSAIGCSVWHGTDGLLAFCDTTDRWAQYKFTPDNWH